MSWVAPHVGIAALRAEPSSRSEQVSELWCGERLEVLERKADAADPWVRIRGGDGYEGWVSVASVAPVEESWPGPASFRVGAREAALREIGGGVTVRRLYFGAVLQRIGAAGAEIAVRLPGGVEGRLPAADERPFYGAPVSTRERFERLVEALMGVPYRWGGRSVAGFDCSGFTQTVTRELGIVLPRDAWQQEAFAARHGAPLDRSAVGPADLLFWGEGARATHVGLALDARRFAHARVVVRIGTWGSGPDVDLENRFRGAYRILSLAEPEVRRRIHERRAPSD
jgi:hypothetical protein